MYTTRPYARRVSTPYVGGQWYAQERYYLGMVGYTIEYVHIVGDDVLPNQTPYAHPTYGGMYIVYSV